jgi:hypothetical protein
MPLGGHPMSDSLLYAIGARLYPYSLALGLVWLAANGLGDITQPQLSKAVKVTMLRGMVKLTLLRGEVNRCSGIG